MVRFPVSPNPRTPRSKAQTKRKSRIATSHARVTSTTSEPEYLTARSRLNTGVVD